MGLILGLQNQAPEPHKSPPVSCFHLLPCAPTFSQQPLSKRLTSSSLGNANSRQMSQEVSPGQLRTLSLNHSLLGHWGCHRSWGAAISNYPTPLSQNERIAHLCPSLEDWSCRKVPSPPQKLENKGKKKEKESNCGLSTASSTYTTKIIVFSNSSLTFSRFGQPKASPTTQFCQWCCSHCLQRAINPTPWMWRPAVIHLSAHHPTVPSGVALLG